MTFLRRIMLGGGVDIEALPETHKLYYTSNKIIPINSDPFDAPIIKHIYDSNTGNGVIICVKEIKEIYGGQVFKNNKDITHIIIPDSVIEIQGESFSGCENLRSINIPDKVSHLGSKILYRCTNLENLTIGRGITSSGKYPLEQCALNCEGSVTVNFNIPNFTSSHFDYFYYACFDEIIIGESVTSIGNYAFYETPVKRLIIGDSVTTIGNYALYFCRKLTSVTIGNGVTTIGEGAFNSCPLTSVTIGNSVKTIGKSAFANSNLTSVNIPDSVTTIGESVFYNCSSLTEFTGKGAEDNGRILVVDGVLTAFAPADITEYDIPDSVTSIENYAFASCNSLTNITIPNSVTKIGKQAFWYCDGLTSVTIGDSVTSIGESAFQDCGSLTSVYCKAPTPPSLDDKYVFADNSRDRKIYVPMESVDAYKKATNWSGYASYIEGYEF